MALREFLFGHARDFYSALRFLRTHGILKQQADVSCLREHNGGICGSVMHESKRNNRSLWRCSKHRCSGTWSVLDRNEFFIHRETKIGLHVVLELIWYWLYTTQSIGKILFNTGISPNTIIEWLNHCRTTVAKALEHEPKFIDTEANPIHIDQAKISGSAKYNKGCRLAGDSPENANEDAVLDWNPTDDDEGDGDQEFVRFGEDNADWKLVVGIYHGPGNVRFVRVPNRTSRTLLAMISKYCAPGSMIHTDVSRAYEAMKDHGYVRKVVIHDENYV